MGHSGNHLSDRPRPLRLLRLALPPVSCHLRPREGLVRHLRTPRDKRLLNLPTSSLLLPSAPLVTATCRAHLRLRLLRLHRLVALLEPDLRLTRLRPALLDHHHLEHYRLWVPPAVK